MQTVRKYIVNFAAQKLLNVAPDKVTALAEEQKMACLSHRLPIEMMSSTYTGMEQQKKQVEAHLRVALKIEDGFRTIQTVCPSEPILAEGAWTVMHRSDFDAPSAMQSILSGFSVNQGDRGELVALLLLILARDAAVAPKDEQSRSNAERRVFSVITFLECLFQLGGRGRMPPRRSSRHQTIHRNDIFEARPSLYKTEEEANRSLKDAFADAKMHFNHFIKVHDRKLLCPKYLLFFASRGIGVLCGNSQGGIDAFLPFTYRGSQLTLENMGVILWQFKNDGRYTSGVKEWVFDAMNPYELGLFHEEADAVVPVIRVVFALAGKIPCLKVRPRPPPLVPSPTFTAEGSKTKRNSSRPGKSRSWSPTKARARAMSKGKGKAKEGDVEEEPQEPKKFTAYDIWCSGLTSDTYAPITERSEKIWASILRTSQEWKKIYKSPSHKYTQLRQSQNPGAAAQAGFFSSWVRADLLDVSDSEESSGTSQRRSSSSPPSSSQSP
ncbi:hypothetical protein EW146_g8931 [Bondarzewia mesenterica]|uniref:Uncharacterized protein n=1 Tax=Bondarzewia mesenterica TaxID=1095465 RepID=A0A4S4LBU7_9AGAM|nr:hypothetical protein EW146_g8931 [Bondarzewia mesenterica]